MINKVKTGLVMEGGAMRGMFTAGVIDVLMEHGLTFDAAIGVSAGACFGCNYKSKQIGRVIRYNKKYCNDRRYVSWHSLFTTGDLYNAQFAYEAIPNTLDPFDFETFKSNPMKFYVVATDVNTGKAIYHECVDSGPTNVQWMRASASMPLVSQVVSVEGYSLSDGGTADSIPLQQFETLGYSKNVVILTQPQDYVKGKNKFMWLIKMILHRYPQLVHALAVRPEVYNQQLQYVAQQEAKGNALVIRPPYDLKIGPVEHNPEELERVYQIGRKTATGLLPQINEFLAQ